MTPGSEISARPYFCCVKKNEGSNELSPFGSHVYPAKVSMSLFHFSQGKPLLNVVDLTIPRAVAIKCSPLSESVPRHMLVANEDSAFAALCLP